jgi:hypothetical protein
MVALRRQSSVWRGLAGIHCLYFGGRVEASHALGLALASLDHICFGLGCTRDPRCCVRCSAHFDTRRPAQSGLLGKPRQNFVYISAE